MTKQPTKLKPLKITCTSTDCESDLHCFLQKKRKNKQYVGGACRSCSVDLVQWDRVQARNITDVKYTFAVQQKELIRHEFWHRDFDEHALRHARRKGKVLLRAAVEKRLRNSVGRAKNPREGYQTPYKGNVIYYAQHALACCCRKCIEYWHGIEPGRPLTDEEVAYFTKLVMLYVDRRLPWLKNDSEKIPRQPKAA